jgi:CheY-like chemotaxis protein
LHTIYKHQMKTILVIEDKLEIRENIVEILELAGYKVHSAENGTKGLTLAKETLPDLVLCDIMMPETNGYEVIRQLKESADTSKIPFVFVTASVEKKEAETGLNMGAIAYVRKPFEINELLSTVESVLKQQHTI